LSEWHVTPDYIENNWTDEERNLMIESLVKRKEREKKVISGNGSDKQMVSDKELFRQLGNKVKVTKK